MNFEQLKQRVERTEALVDGRMEQTENAYRMLRGKWRDGWTPVRILLAGGIAGFLVGKTQPIAAIGKLGGPNGQRWIQLVTSLSGLVTAVRVKSAAKDAEAAADDVQDAAADVEAAADEVSNGDGGTGGASGGGTQGGAAAATPRVGAPERTATPVTPQPAKPQPEPVGATRPPPDIAAPRGSTPAQAQDTTSTTQTGTSGPRPHPSDARRMPDASPQSPTAAAEAATELSER